ncbi:MAG: AAA family ATPase, partial [Oscillospiraceae bacterium]|nr:AAA family ATPase [Oscillospiraceae bacterium]
EYTALCRYETGRPIPVDSRIITSDDVFDFMLNVRHLNEGVDRRREDLLDAYVDAKYNSGGFQMRSLEDYDRLKQVVSAQKHSQSQYVRENLNRNVREHSNGESAFQYFTEKIQENGLYLLDEPENSLAPALQRQLVDFLSDSARFFGCQFLIATHSPFLLAMRGAKIYDLDADPVRVRPWTDLPGIRAYYDFFREHAPEFDGP